MTIAHLTTLILAALHVVFVPIVTAEPRRTILNVSYDPTRELYAEINPAFVAHWKSTTGESVSVKQSHGGSGKQARSVIDGLEADVVTLAVPTDIDAIHDVAELLPKNWRELSASPSSPTPYTSTIVFLVRKGNPKAIKDWHDLGVPGLSVVSPNPKTSGGARWNYLAAWGFELRQTDNDQTKAREFVTKVLRNISIFDTGARGATNTFVQRRIGDVLIGWESDALLVQREFPENELEIVYPSVSIRAEPPVAIVERVAAKRKTTDLAKGYIEFLYSDSAQEIIARHFFRPSSPTVAEKHASQFKPIPLFTVEELFGCWSTAQKAHFDEGGTFDQIQAEISKNPE